MGAPYKMKYTNGKKADTAAFPFKPSPGKQMAAPTGGVDPKMQEAMKKKVDEVVTKKVDAAVGDETNI
tara:strand:+ start:130 stop:333 length:204 start_codon:yes stop_codon:yes gene_type:complete